MFNQSLKDKFKDKFIVAFILIGILVSGCQSKTASVQQQVQIPEPKVLDQTKIISKIQIGSCAHQKYPQPLWKTMLAENPDLYIAAGDNVYASSSADKPIEQAYKLQSLQPEFALYRSQVPTIATWDDHDYGQNDGGTENPEKEDAKLNFLKFWPNDAQAIDPRQGGVYHSFLIGSGKQSVQIILLDTRYFRDALVKSNNPPYPPGPYVATQNKQTTILGSTQWQWLENELKKSSSLKIIVSSIQFLPKEHGFEKWDNFPHERDRLLSLLTAYKNVLIVSGDRHAGEISSLQNGKTRLFEITASGINRNSTLSSEKNKYRFGERILESNFGQIEIDWKRKSLNISLIDITRKKITNKVINF